jgi:hypothetical protein
VPRVSEQRRGGAVNKQKFVCRNNKRLVEKHVDVPGGSFATGFESGDVEQ